MLELLPFVNALVFDDYLLDIFIRVFGDIADVRCQCVSFVTALVVDDILLDLSTRLVEDLAVVRCPFLFEAALLRMPAMPPTIFLSDRRIW